MLVQHKKYRKPRKPFDKARIESEDEIIKKYGLANKKEIWKADAHVTKIRNQAKNLITSSEKEKDAFKNKVVKMGLISENAKIDDILALNKENILERRLQTIVFKKRFATKPKQARQLITHKHILVAGNVINIPSYIVPINLENEIKLKEKIKKKQKQVLPQEQPAQEEQSGNQGTPQEKINEG